MWEVIKDARELKKKGGSVNKKNEKRCEGNCTYRLKEWKNWKEDFFFGEMKRGFI
jgi:hypothetical protein